jgi:hypothetical protein
MLTVACKYLKVPSMLTSLPQITSFGYNAKESLILGVPGGAVEIVALLLNGYVGHITGQRILASLGGLVAAIIGMLLIVALPLSNNVGRLIGYYLTQASPTPFVALLSLISSNVAGYTKKTTVAALYLIGYCAGNIIGESTEKKEIRGKRNMETTLTQLPGPQTFRPQDAPRYVPAEVTVIVCWGVCLFLLVGVWMWYRRENKKKILFTARSEYVRLENQE